MLYTQPHTRGHDIMHFCGEITGQKGLRKERTGSKQMWILRLSCCTLTQSTAPRLCWTAFLRGEKSGLLWDQGLSSTTCCTCLHLLSHWGIQSTPLPPYSSMLTYWNSFKSSTHWCNTPSWRLLACTLVQHTSRKSNVQYLLPRYKDKSTPSDCLFLRYQMRKHKQAF